MEESYLNQVFWEEASKFDVQDQLEAIHTPTLLMGGRNDPFFPVDYLESFHRKIPGSELVILENSDHDISEADVGEYQAAVKRILENTGE